jgi:hypothetical protein
MPRVALEKSYAPTAGSLDLYTGTSQVNAFVREENSLGTASAFTFLQVLCRRGASISELWGWENGWMAGVKFSVLA